MSIEASGSVDYTPKVWFDIFHHHPFSYNKKSGMMEYNSNPHGDPRFVRITDVSRLEDGFAFSIQKKKKGQIQTVTHQCHDTTVFEGSLTEHLCRFIDGFHLLEGFHTGFRGTWSSSGAISVTITSWKKGFSSDFLSFKRVNDELYVTYTIDRSHPGPYVNRVSSISFKDDGLFLVTDQGAIEYEYGLQSDLHDFLKSFFEIGYGGLVHIER
ncbi:MAG: hypothetical protein FWD11_02395 [Micrococcales bacterium]|nr:hypothetical protein [Micrococcales bacterium]